MPPKTRPLPKKVHGRGHALTCHMHSFVLQSVWGTGTGMGIKAELQRIHKVGIWDVVSLSQARPYHVRTRSI